MNFIKGIVTLCFLVTLMQIVEVSAESMVEPDEQQRVLITFKEDINESLIEEIDGEINFIFDSMPTVSVTISESGLNELKGSPQISKIERDILVRTKVQIQDWGIQSINAPLAWETRYSGKGVKVAVIDTGISAHEDLVIAGGQSFVDYTTSYSDDNGHGTHVAGIIAARDNGFGIKGVASEAELYAIKSINQDGTSYLSNIIAGIDWAILNNMDVINMSLGTQVNSSVFQNIINKAYNQGILLVAAAGNDGTGSGDTVDYPARYPSVIGVGAIDQQNAHASFSSTGPSVEVAAPGVSVLSTYMNGAYARLNGTSMASPFVAGYLALLKQAYPDLTNVQLRSILIENTKDLGVEGLDPLFGFGLIQASTFTQPLFSMPASGNPAIELIVNNEGLQGYPGETHQLKGIVKLNDGTVLDITNDAIWISSNELFASVVNGEIVFNDIGSATITAVYGGLSTSIVVETLNAKPVLSVVDFSDVSPDFWAYQAINQLREKKIISGFGDNTFKPNTSIRRDHVAVLFTKSIVLEENIEVLNFIDVPLNYVYYEEIKQVQQAGIFSGDNGKFEPQTILTRAQMAKVLVNAFSLEKKGEHQFTDVSANHWSSDYIDILYSNGITIGFDGKYNPEGPVTRAHFAAFLTRTFELKGY